MKRFVISALVAALVAGPALACSCLYPESPEAQMEGADLVFEGQVINVAPEALQLTWWQKVQRAVMGPPEFEMRREVTTFQVSREIKGEAGRNIAIVHLPGEFSATCGTSFRSGETYIVLAYESSGDGLYSTSSCSRAAYPNEAYQSPAPE